MNKLDQIDKDFSADEVFTGELDAINAESTIKPEDERQNFFFGGHWGQSFQLLQHLCQYSEQIVVVTGETGLGKTALLQAFLQDKNFSNRLAYIDASDVTETYRLLESIAMEFGFSIDDNGSAELDIDISSIDNKIWVLLIDNAEKLSQSQRNILLKLGRPRGTAGQLRVVFCGSPELTKILNPKLLLLYGCDNAHFIALEPLQLEEVVSFINYYWKESGLTGVSPFSEKIVKKMYKASGGNFGKLIHLVNAYLNGRTIRTINFSLPKFSGFKFIFAGSILLTLVIIVGLLLWPTSSEKVSQPLRLPEEQAMVMNTTPKLPYPATKKSVAEVIREEDKKYQENEEVNNSEQVLEYFDLDKEHNAIPILLQKELNAGSNKKTNFVTDTIAREEVIKSKKLKDLSKEDSVSSGKNKADIAKITKVKSQEKVNAAGKSKSYIATSTISFQVFNFKGEVTTFPRKSYTLQLLGASNETNVRNFIKTNNISKQAFYYKSARQGKPWFVLLYGDYATKESATMEQQRLAHILKLTPIIRGVDTLSLRK